MLSKWKCYLTAINQVRDEKSILKKFTLVELGFFIFGASLVVRVSNGEHCLKFSITGRIESIIS
jgi:hypothetical protein